MVRVSLQTAVTITGMLARTLELSSWCAYHCGLAISPDASILAVALSTRKIDIFRLSDGALHSTIGGNGTGPGQFSNLGRICFSPLSGHLLALDTARVQELTVAGAHVRSIDLSEMREACLSIAASREMIAVGTAGNGHQVWLYDQSSFELIRSFGTKGWDPGYLMDSYSLRFMPDGVHVIVAEDVNHRLSIFTSTGEFVRCVGVGTLDCPIDVDFASNGDVLVVDVDAERVTVFSGDGFSLLRSIDMTSFDSGAFKWPHALAVHGEQLFLLGRHGTQLLALN